MGLIAEEQRPGVALAGDAAEAFSQGVIPVLGAGDLEIADQVFGHGDDRVAGAVEGFVQAGGEEAGFQAGAAEEGVLGEGDALEGEQFLGVDGFVDGDKVGFEAGDGFQVFEADDGEVGRGEAMAAGGPGGTPAGAGLAFGGARTGRMGCVRAVSGKLPGGNGALGAGRSGGRHCGYPPLREIARWRTESAGRCVQVRDGKVLYFRKCGDCFPPVHR